MQSKYQEVIEYINEHYIESNSFNGQIPSEPTLAKTLGISRFPVNRAYNILAKKGILTKIGGIGTFVTNREPEKFRNKKSTVMNVIGLAYFNNPGFELTDALQEILTQAGYITVNIQYNNNVHDQDKILDYIKSLNVKSVFIIPEIFFGKGEHPNYAFAKVLAENNIDVLVLDRPLEGYNGTQILVDNAGGTAMAVEYMLKSGRKNIAYIGKDDYSVGKERFSGYLNALRREDIKIDNSLIFLNRQGYHFIETLESFIKESLQKLFKSCSECNSFVCFGSLMAYKTYTCIKDMNLLTDDMLFAGYDKPQVYDHDFEKRFIAIERPMKEIGRIGAETLLSLHDSCGESVSIIKRILPSMHLPVVRKNVYIDRNL